MITVLIGKSGSGKNTIRDILVDTFGYKPIVTYTTRPKRDGEVDGETYHFISEKEFDELDFIETTYYNVANGETWWYGTLRSDFEQMRYNSDKSVIILNPEGVDAIRKQIDLNSLSIIYLCCSEEELKRRLLLRGDSLREIYRRLNADEEDFRKIVFNTKVENNDSKSPLAIADYINCIVNNYIKIAEEYRHERDDGVPLWSD